MLYLGVDEIAAKLDKHEPGLELLFNFDWETREIARIINSCDCVESNKSSCGDDVVVVIKLVVILFPLIFRRRGVTIFRIA